MRRLLVAGCFVLLGAGPSLSADKKPLDFQEVLCALAERAPHVDLLPDGVDRFGENGEFHTLVTPPLTSWRNLQPARALGR